MGLELFLGVGLVLLILKWVLRNANKWYYERKLGEKAYDLPPGDLGWPFVGNMREFWKAFKSSNPESFIASFASRFGNTGIYKANLFGNPSIIVTTAEGCRKVLCDDETFKYGWPESTEILVGKNSFVCLSDEDHKWLRKLTAAPVNGPEALSVYLKYIEENVVEALKEWETMGQIEFLSELRKLTFKIIMHIFLSAEGEEVSESLEKEYTALNYGVRALGINIPGFAYHKALQGRKRLVAILQGILTRRREEIRKNPERPPKDMADALLDAKDENGRQLIDEEIIDVMIMYLNAGHESSGHTTMWAAVFLKKNPDVFKKARAEQEEIVKKRPADQKGLTLKEVRQMEYLAKVIDETLRVVSFALTAFREARKDINIGGYTIPKGWKVLVWFRGPHYDSETFPEPKKFDPSRWDGFTPKAGNFIPFGAGGKMCPGQDLAKLEVSVFLHHFLLNYELEQHNPSSPVIYLPHTRPLDNCLGRIKRVSAAK